MGRRAQAIGLSLGLAAASLGGPASAALAPIYESIREISAILADPRLAQAVGAGVLPITSITDNGKGGYVFATERCTVTVTVVTVPPQPGKPMMAGPRQFTLEFGTPDCK
jgi:hypothetical protein